MGEKVWPVPSFVCRLFSPSTSQRCHCSQAQAAAWDPEGLKAAHSHKLVNKGGNLDNPKPPQWWGKTCTGKGRQPQVGRDPQQKRAAECGQGWSALGAGVQVRGDPSAMRGEMWTGLLMGHQLHGTFLKQKPTQAEEPGPWPAQGGEVTTGCELTMDGDGLRRDAVWPGVSYQHRQQGRVIQSQALG